jgi:hypothetical protein
MKLNDYVSISAEFAKLLVTNLMVINAGALLVFPSILQALKRNELDLNSSTWAATFFVFGLVLAGLCGYAAYLNFMCLGMSSAHSENLRDFRSKCTPEMLELEANKIEIAKMEKSIGYNNLVAKVGLYLGNLFGLASGLVFCVGCYYVRSSMLI